MSNDFDFDPASPDSVPISPQAFAYLDRLSHTTVTKVIEDLVTAGDVDNLENALEGGCARSEANKRMALLLNMLWSAAGYSQQDERFIKRSALAEKWLAAIEESNGADAANVLARKVIDEASSEGGLVVRLELLEKAPSGLNVHAIDEYRQIPVERRARADNVYDEASLLGLLVEHGSVDLAIRYAGADGALSSFPVTRIFRTADRGRETMNLVEHIAMSSQLGWPQLQHLIAKIAPSAEEPWYQLGDMVLRILQRHSGKNPLSCSVLTDCSYDGRRFQDQNRKDEEDYFAPVFPIIGLGARFRNPAEAWTRIREAVLTGPDPQTGEARPDIPLAHALLFVDPDVYPRSLCAAALKRMIEEGGLPVEQQADMSGGKVVRLLQIAAITGHTEAAEVLLSHGADPTIPGTGEISGSPLDIAKGTHEELEQMFLAHQARKAIDSVLSMPRPPAPDEN